MPVEAEQLLDPHRQDRPLLAAVVDRDPRAGRRLDMRRRLGVEPAPQRPGQEAVQGLAQDLGAEIGEAGPADEVGREPVLDGGGERLVGQVRPFLPLGPAQERDPLAPLREGLRPGQDPTPSAAMPRASARAASSVAGTGSGRSARTSAP